jgi:MFS superfamily sulfate permease-like transporter
LRDFVVWLVAFIVTTFAGVELGLMSSIALSLLILVLESSFPHTAQLGRIGKSNVYRSAAGTGIYVWLVACRRQWRGVLPDLLPSCRLLSLQPVCTGLGALHHATLNAQQN